MAKQPEHYNLESIYDEKISPLMRQIIDICKEHNMPMVASFAYENNEEKGIGCCTTKLIFEGRYIKEFAEATSIIRGNPLLSAFTIMSGVKDQ
ncbi:hypothetical protein D2912_04320 [Klebsiella pneumoniae]|uniref:hypothetical protein n=1 Tax=Klebsiella pneumoniae TaxID=573 RepID=UPI001C803D0A|nr:hypothetical protein [Klebsiella pneumoniae]MBX4575639.1 hypothetical protein [Klebsiella pneumoniae]HBZ1570543.1 hypothetical protein [Klebsiella pneumoniae]HCK1137594.1 hypothetical protein [Klebsiella michiganensis]